MRYEIVVYQANELDAEPIARVTNSDWLGVQKFVEIYLAMNRYLDNKLMLTIEPIEEKERR